MAKFRTLRAPPVISMLRPTSGRNLPFAEVLESGGWNIVYGELRPLSVIQVPMKTAPEGAVVVISPCLLVYDCLLPSATIVIPLIISAAATGSRSFRSRFL